MIITSIDQIKLPEILGSEEQLRQIWSNPITRRDLIQKLEKAEGLAARCLESGYTRCLDQVYGSAREFESDQLQEILASSTTRWNFQASADSLTVAANFGTLIERHVAYRDTFLKASLRGGVEMDQLENLAVGYYFLLEEFPRANYFLICVFALLWGTLKPVSDIMPRSTYFLNLSGIFVAGTFVQSVWIFSKTAMANGYLFAIMAIDIATWAVIAYALVVLSKSRSNDAYGDSRHAYLAFIPIAGFWLLFRPSKREPPYNLPSYLTDTKAVIAGICFMIGGIGLSINIGNSIDSSFAAITDEEIVSVKQRVISYYISKGSLSEALQYEKSFESIGSNYNESTVLQDIIVLDDVMEYRFFITDTSTTSFTQEQADLLADNICQSYAQLIDAGATIAMHFSSDLQPILARIAANNATCIF